MEFIKVKYPSEDENWYQFGNLKGAVKIQNEEVEKWVNDCIQSIKKQLENNIDCSPYAFVASGDTMVIAFFSQDIQEDIWADENYITVIIARDYEEGTFSIEELKKKDKKIEDKTLKELVNSTEVIKQLELDGYEISIKKKEEV